MAIPSRHQPNPGGGTTMKFFWALLVALAAAQLQSPDIIHNLNTYLRSTQSTKLSASDRPQPGRSPAEIPLLNHDTTTLKFRNTEDSIANAERFKALAPADIAAVRAPLTRSGESNGLSSLSPARTLQDWEAENIVLLATIDGAIHARDRRTGQHRWSLVPENPMIETVHHRSNRSTLDDSHPDDDYIFIVEPSQDGALYIQHKDPRIGLQRLGMTVRSLAQETPYFVDDPALATTAQMETSIFTIDAASGNFNQTSNQGTFVNDDQQSSCRRTNGFELDDQACEPFGTLHVGRTQYTVTITSSTSHQVLCTIKYTEWTPNRRDIDLQTQHQTPVDNCHIQTLHNGRIIAFDNSQNLERPRGRFTQVLESPVARIYDIFRPIDNNDGKAPLVMLPQPVDSAYLSRSLTYKPELMRSRVFVNQTVTGNWYALSEESYPGVTSGAPQAGIFTDFDPFFVHLDFERDTDKLKGVHQLSDIASDVPQKLMTISPPPSMDLNTSQGAVVPVSVRQPPAEMSVVRDATIITMLLGVLAFVVLLSNKRPLARFIQKWLRKAGYHVTVQAIPVEPYGNASTAELRIEDSLESAADLATVSDGTGESLTTAIVAYDSVQAVSVAQGQTSLPTPPHSRAQSTAQELVMTRFEENSSDGDSEEELSKQVSSEGQPLDDAEPKKKKAKRGKRGGRHNKKKKQMSPEAMDESETKIVSEGPTKDGMLQVGRLKLNTNYDRCLGHGSNGTAVFPGVFDGREVAVKRLLRSSTSLAAKEIKHLLSSDENPHVVRYFGKEESPNFTYIALDLFTASLDQVVEHPDRYPTLVTYPDGFDIKDALKQITYGVQHLHSLKLVHRDIKPQNVLVRAVKSSRPVVGMPKLHFVISDFGLCKPLEEGPESTFAPTANHTAAGTTGWRAPELLVNARAAIAAPASTSTTSIRSTSHSSDGTVLDPPSGRRATKAIDIFSLGCVFYYVMTQGHHPFDVGGHSLARDLNIKENKYSTSGLQLYGCESYDAEDLIMQMINHNPKLRPDTNAVLHHPYFWDVDWKLDFLCDVSDCYEKEKNLLPPSVLHYNEPPTTSEERHAWEELQALEALAPNVIGSSKDFLKALPRSFVSEMGRQRKYSKDKMIDLLRVIRNKKNHFHDLPEDVREMMLGGTTKGYYQFWATRFPSLLINCHCLVVERGLVAGEKEGWKLGRYF